MKWIANYDNQFKGMMPARQALAESRNAVAIWMVQQIGIDSLLQTAQDVGIRTKLQPYDTTALGASEVTLLELANAYRFMASGIHMEPYVIEKIVRSGGEPSYTYDPSCCTTNENDAGLSMIQEGLARRRANSVRHRARTRLAQLPHSRDGQDRHNKRFP